MIRTYILYVLLLFPLLISGCWNGVQISPILQRADSLVYTNPDSAYHLLLSLPSSEKCSELEYATWCLLMTQATDKSYRKHTSDSLIHIAVRYFSEYNDDKKKLATALYTQGRVERDLHKYDDAIKSYMKALELLNGSDEYKLQYLIFSQIGHIYAYSKMNEKAAFAYNKCFSFANLAKDSVSIAYANAYLGRIYGVQKDWNESKESYKQAIAVAEKIKSICPLRLALNELSMIYSYTNQYDSVYYCLNKLLELPNTKQENEAIYLSLGNFCRLTDNYDSAVFYLNKALNTSNMYTKRSTYQCLAYLYEEQHKYKDAITSYKLSSIYNDSILLIENRKDIAEVEQKYQNEKLKSSLQRAFFIGVISIILIILFILLNRWKHKKTILKYYVELENVRAKIKENDEKITMLKHKIEMEYIDKKQIQLALESEIQSLIMENNELKKQKANIYSLLSERKEEIDKNKKIEKKKDIYPNILVRIEKFKVLDKSEWEELFIMTNALHNQYVKRLLTSYPDITNNELIVFCLLKLGYSRKEISDIIEVSEDAVQKRLLRSKVHFYDHKKWNKGEFEQFIKNF